MGTAVNLTDDDFLISGNVEMEWTPEMAQSPEWSELLTHLGQWVPLKINDNSTWTKIITLPDESTNITSWPIGIPKNPQPKEAP